jgi:hypothetical protein
VFLSSSSLVSSVNLARTSSFCPLFMMYEQVNIIGSDVLHVSHFKQTSKKNHFPEKTSPYGRLGSERPWDKTKSVTDSDTTITAHPLWP